MIKSDNNFKHIILTKFNLVVPCNSYESQVANESVLGGEWLEKRIELFEKYCLNSLLNQTNKNFSWLIYFDKNTGAAYKEKAEAWVKKYNFIFIKYVTFEEISKLYGLHVQELAKGFNYVMTSRIDNDDAYHCQALEYIQNNFQPEHNLALNLYKGYRLVHGKKALLLKNRFMNGPFLTLIEDLRLGLPKTVFCSPHDTFFKNFKIKQIKNDYLWLQNVHGQNLVNDLQGIPTFRKDFLKNFGLDPLEYNFDLYLILVQMIKFFINPKNYIPFKLKIYILEKLGKR